ncbi:NAD-dependent epimerase/dehydratase family protein [Candidatus Omnitrophota bacterium]
MKKKSFLITGGSGFIGSALVRDLAPKGFRIKVLDNGLRARPDRLEGIKGQIELIQADIRDPKAVREACKGIDCVYHLAYLNGTQFFYSRPDLVLDIGVKGMVNVIDSCVAQGVGELMLLSSSEVYQTPPSVPTGEDVPLIVPDPFNARFSYGGGKIISELMAINYGRKYFRKSIVVRPHNIYGPDMGWEHVIPQFVVRMKELCRKEKGETIRFPIQGSGEQTRSFCYIDDFVDAFGLLAEKGEHLSVYNIGTSEEIRIKEVALAAGAYFGKEAAVVPGEEKEGSTPRRCPDISKIKKLGYSPKVAFNEGFRRTAEWYENNMDKRPADDGRREEFEAIRTTC